MVNESEYGSMVGKLGCLFFRVGNIDFSLAICEHLSFLLLKIITFSFYPAFTINANFLSLTTSRTRALLLIAGRSIREVV